jgi:hypothetical protein
MVQRDVNRLRTEPCASLTARWHPTDDVVVHDSAIRLFVVGNGHPLGVHFALEESDFRYAEICSDECPLFGGVPKQRTHHRIRYFVDDDARVLENAHELACTWQILRNVDVRLSRCLCPQRQRPQASSENSGECCDVYSHRTLSVRVYRDAICIYKPRC